jgi:nucleotide-binding universal stress UspA family protein
MSKPILVGYDAVPADRGPVHFGLAAARFTGAPLIIASVAESGEEPGDDTAGALDFLRQSVDFSGLQAEFTRLTGRSAPAALHDAAEASGAGLLVIGSTADKHDGVLRPGSTAERLMHGAPCPIAVVPHGWEAGGGLKTIGVAYAPTEEGREAVTAAMALARRSGAGLRVLAAVKPRHFGRAGGGHPGHEATSYDQVGADEASITAEAMKLIGNTGGVEVEADVSAQEPADFLIAASENVDLLVCGSRGYGPRKAVLLGGVSRQVVRGARCPVIVLGRGIEMQLEDLISAAAPTTA